MNRFDFESKISKVESTNGAYISYQDHVKEIAKIKSEKLGSRVLCESCSKSKLCVPRNRYGVVAIECEKYKKRLR